MCGIVGIVERAGGPAPEQRELRQMLGMIRHRGPDEFGIYCDDRAGLGSARLSIIDLSSGQMPIPNEDRSLWIVFNGEIFNYRELRQGLVERGHRFTTHTDTEVILHLFEERGPECLSQLNGQFAIAIWNVREQSLFLARDRLGVRPIFYAVAGGALVFGSEIKALLATGRMRAELDPVALGQTFQCWSPQSPRTVFRGITELPPGHYLLAHPGRVDLRRYWQLEFPGPETSAPRFSARRSVDSWLEEFTAILVEATRTRLHADVPVGAYLSGGLDSSIIAALIRRDSSSPLDTFSIAFRDAQFDESRFQQQMAKALGTDHQVLEVSHTDIAEVFPKVIWHTEVPLMRTAPAPMFMLSRLVRERGYKVVLTGEGADEFLAGYDIFKEAKLRRFWARRPDSRWRSLLLQRLYADIPGFAKTNPAFLSAFYREGLTATDSPTYSHDVRWRNTGRTRRFFSDELRASLARESEGVAPAEFPAAFEGWGPLERAQYVEIVSFLSPYLLSSQGDRMGMANSVEGRFPFLDKHVVSFCNSLPSNLKLRGLQEKFLLRKLGEKLLPAEIASRPKRPYRAPIHKCFFHERTPAYVRELLSDGAVEAAGLFNPVAVQHLVRKIEQGAAIGETDDMALVGVLSAQLVHQLFVSSFARARPVSDDEGIKVCGPELASAR